MGIITSFLGLEAAGVSIEDAAVLFAVVFAFAWIGRKAVANVTTQGK